MANAEATRLVNALHTGGVSDRDIGARLGIDRRAVYEIRRGGRSANYGRAYVPQLQALSKDWFAPVSQPVRRTQKVRQPAIRTAKGALPRRETVRVAPGALKTPRGTTAAAHRAAVTAGRYGAILRDIREAADRGMLIRPVVQFTQVQTYGMGRGKRGELTLFGHGGIRASELLKLLDERGVNRDPARAWEELALEYGSGRGADIARGPERITITTAEPVKPGGRARAEYLRRSA